jgi:hypothetical protein
MLIITRSGLCDPQGIDDLGGGGMHLPHPARPEQTTHFIDQRGVDFRAA